MAHIVMRFPKGKAKAVTLSYDDGVEQDIRLVELLQRHGLKGTFNLNSGLYAPEGTVYPADQIHRRMTLRQAQALLRNSGMEVAVHGLNHPFLEQLSPENCAYEVLKDRENLESQFDCLVRGLAYPYGTYDKNVKDCLRCCGIAYARTVQSTYRFDLPTEWLEWHPTCHHADPRLMELTRLFLDKIILNKPWVFYLWGHSYEFDKAENWEVIQAFAQRVGGREDIWYATNMELYDYSQAFRSLRFSADGKRVYNPTAWTLWVESDRQMVCLKPGEERILS